LALKLPFKDKLQDDLIDKGETKTLIDMANLVQTAARTSLQIQVRVDDQRLRRRSVDILPELFEILKEKKQELLVLEASPIGRP